MPDTGPLRVLLIEDDEDDYLLTRDLLEEFAGARLQVEWSSTYAGGRARLLEQKFDVCLLDFRLGAGNGLELLRDAIGQGCRTPVILLTGQDDRATDLAAMQSGAADYLVKGEISARLLERSIRYARERQRLLEQIRAMSLTDELTGLLNRRGFLTLGEQQLRMAERTARPLLLVFVDLDGMKQVNDRFGHRAGDQMLVDTAELLRVTFRSTDVIARLGGDEFVALAGDVDAETAQAIADRLRANLEGWNASGARPYPLAMSTGFLEHDPAQRRPLEALLDEADARMYLQKHARRARSAAATVHAA